MEDPMWITNSESYREQEGRELSWKQKLRYWQKRRGPPYHAYGHPELVTTQGSFGGPEAYHRSLSIKGNGIPLHYPASLDYNSVEYRSKGLSIGDVGYVSGYDGSFQFHFNIFLQANDPIHSEYVPREHKPIEPPLGPSELRITPNYFKPGTIITSQGVEMRKHSESPLDVSFASTEKEGGILILPDGATREDMISTDRLYEYVKRNAPHWYQAINGYGGVGHTNGDIILVTGCDKTRNFALAGFPHHYSRTIKTLDIRYTENGNEYDSYPWRRADLEEADYRCYEPSKEIPDLGEAAQTQCVFIRGLRFSLSELAWWDVMRDGKILVNGLPTYILDERTRVQSWFNKMMLKMKIRRDEGITMYGLTWDLRQFFHPAFMINQVLLCTHPKAEIAILSDEVWLRFAESHSHCTLTEMFSLVTQVFDTHDPQEANGTVTLIPKQAAEAPKEVCKSKTSRMNKLNRSTDGTRWVRHYYLYDWLPLRRRYNK